MKNHNMKSKKYTVKKVPIQDLLIALNEAYEIGADYIDITLIYKGDEERDQLLLDIQEDYYAEDIFEEEKKLDESDFNNLIG